MRLHLRRPWLAGLVVGLPIAVVALVVAYLFPSLGSIGPAAGPAGAVGIVVASMVMAELAAHRHVRPWVAVVAWIAVAHATATILILGTAVAGTEASTLMASGGVLFGFALVVLGLAVPWVAGGIVWLLAVRRLSAPAVAAAGPTEGSPRADQAVADSSQDGGATAAEASTADATASGS